MKTNLSLFFKITIALSIGSIIAFAFYQAATAQRKNNSKAIQKSEDVLQSETVSRVQPKYPPLALAAQVSGQVVVEVTIDEKGDVIMARALSGHPLLKDSSVSAARRWKFNPFVADGAPVQVTGTLTFNFDPKTYVPDPDDEKPVAKKPPLTPEEKEKLMRVEEAANRFVERWHETMDLNVLFDEMYVSDPQQRRLNAGLFYGVYKFLSMSAYGPGVDKDVDEAVMREGFMAFWNMLYLSHEYRLAFQKAEDPETYYHPELIEAAGEMKKMKLNKKRISLAQIRQIIERANHASSLFRKYLTRDVFDTPLYKANLKRCLEDRDGESLFKIGRGFSEYGVGEEKEVYNLQHCMFEFYFVEEAGQLKVLTLGFEL